MPICTVFLKIRYVGAVPELSVDAVHESVRDVCVIDDAERLVGVEGGVVSGGGGFCVVAFMGVLMGEVFPDESTAKTSYEYVVEGERPESLKDAPEGVPTWAPFRYTRYETEPELSVDAVHESISEEEVMFDAARFVGIEGGVVSGVESVTESVALFADTLPHKSTACTW